MRRENRATVKDSNLGAAFTEGVNEGFRLTGYVAVICQIAGKDKVRVVVKASQVPDVVGDFIAGLRGEHYEIGVTIRIIAESDVTPEGDSDEVGGLPEGEDPNIIDAEIVE